LKGKLVEKLEQVQALKGEVAHKGKVLDQLQEDLTFAPLGTTLARIEMRYNDHDEALPVVHLFETVLDLETARSLQRWLADRLSLGEHEVEALAQRKRMP
jgi:hypothetical protein